MSLSLAQLRMRRQGITATDLSAILGENPWRKPIDVWMDKMGYTPLIKIPDGPASIGHAFESAVALHYKKTQCPAGKRWRIWQPTKTIRHPLIAWALATPDRYVFECEQGGVFPSNQDALEGKASHLAEIKLVGPRVLRHWLLDEDNMEVGCEADRIPTYVYCQVQWQMFVSEYRRCDVGALLGGTSFRVFHVEYDQKFLDHALVAATQFWTKNVLGKVQPEPDGSERYKAFLDAHYCAPEVFDLAPAPDGVEDAARAYKTALADKATAETNRELFSQRLKDAVGNGSGFEAPWGTVTWTPNRGQVDYKRLCEDQGIPLETIEKYRTPTRVLRVRMEGEGEPPDVQS